MMPLTGSRRGCNSPGKTNGRHLPKLLRDPRGNAIDDKGAR
jgi:hypothetical protein